MVDDRSIDTSGPEPVFVRSATMRFEVSFLGQLSVLEAEETWHYALHGEGRLLAVRSLQVDDGVESLLVGRVEGDTLQLARRSMDRTTAREVPLPRTSLAEERRLVAWLADAPEVGDRFEQWSVDWEAVDVDLPEAFEYLGMRTIRWGGRPLVVHDAWFESRGLRCRAELGADGALLRVTLGGLIEARLEPEATARDPGAAVDMLLAAAVPVDRDLGEPGNVDELVLRLTGLGDFALPTAARQVVRRDPDGGVTVHLRRDPPVEPEPLTGEERDRYLQPTPRIPCRDEELLALARARIDVSAPPLDNARRLARWVHQSMEQSMASNASTALDVLARGGGDCTELTLLFVALARAAGVPTREVAGIMYAGLDPPAFAWHAWAEVHDGTRWVTVDPTWDQSPVDATHLRLATGREDLSWVSLLGKLRLEVLEVSARPAR